jgi:hypothetical protein
MGADTCSLRCGLEAMAGTGGDAKPRRIWTAGDKWKQGDWADVEAAGREIAHQVIVAAKHAKAIVADIRLALIDVAMPLERPPGMAELRRVTESRTKKSWAEDMM